MDRRSFHRGALLASALPLAGGIPPTASAAVPGMRTPDAALCRRAITEYELPAAHMTHELVRVPGKPLVLVSQQEDSQLVKMRLDPRTQEVTGIRAFPLGAKDATLHGLAVSRRYPGRIWATQEAPEHNRLLLVDPGARGLNAPPRIIRSIPVPGGGVGPHYVGEYGGRLWSTLKGSGHVLSIDPGNPRDFQLYKAGPKPIFVARHPDTGDFYASQDAASAILRIDPRTGRTSQIPVPESRGRTPVGLVSGPGGLWVALLGTEAGGTATFGRIDGEGRITWFTLRSPEVRTTGLLHIAFDPPGTGRGPGVWLLGSSIIAPNSLDVVVRAAFDDGWSRIRGEEVAVLPTQLCKAHRMLPLSRALLVTELTSATVARLTSPTGCHWDQPTTPAPGDPA